MRFLFLFFLVFLISDEVLSQKAEYIWPTDSGNYLSSTFGETRSAHFHAGIDIKTWGREGYRVFASKDGTVSKLLITNQGYGKAIYLKHFDGTYTVYAHLQRFNNQLQAIADSVRFESYSYTMEIDLESDSIKYTQGEIIGFTGSTGIGPPHLHFEIRNQNNEPINPLTQGLTITDTKPPVIRTLLIEPLEMQSKINGSVYPQVFYPDSVRNDTSFFSAINFNGDIGIAVNTFDEADEVFNKYAVYELSLKTQDQIIFSQQLNQFNFDQADYMFLDRAVAPGSSRRQFQKMYLQKDFDHPFLKVNFNKPLSAGEYTLQVKDYFGNTSAALFEIQESDSSSKQNRNFEHWKNDWVSINDSTNVDLINLNVGLEWDSKHQHYLTNFPDSINQGIFRVNNDRNLKLSTADRRITFLIPKKTFFEDLSIRYHYAFDDSSSSISIGSPELSVRKEVFIQVYTDSLRDSNLHLYLKEENEYNFQESYMRGNTLHGVISEFGEFEILSDTTAPEISSPETVTLGNGLKTYSLKTWDNLSGIDFKSAVFIINGERGIPEYDYENDEFTYYHPGFSPKESNQIYFEVKDKAGNISKRTFRLKN